MNAVRSSGILARLMVAALLLGTSLAVGGRPVSASQVIKGSLDYSYAWSTVDCGVPLDMTRVGKYHYRFFAENNAPLDVNGEPILTKADLHDVGDYTATNPTNGKRMTATYADQWGQAVLSYQDNTTLTLEDGTVVPAIIYTLDIHERGLWIKFEVAKGRTVQLVGGSSTDWTVDLAVYHDPVTGERLTTWVGVDDSEIVMHGPGRLFNDERYCQMVLQYLA